jgi:PhnB protein
MQFIPYLDFGGDCRQAFEHYGKVFGAAPKILSYGQSPMADQSPPEMHDKVMHAVIELGGALLMGADGPIPAGGGRRGGVVNAQVEDPAEAERIFAALAEGGSVQMALQETFWALRFGMLIDRFGKGWMVNCGKPMP